jgi:hypothetical protein
MFQIKDRAYSDNTISEVAGKLLPLHPTARYKNFPNLWKKTRQVGGYVPKPAVCAPPENEIFPCCLSCQNSNLENLTEILARRMAYAGWLSAEWWWDFGWVLPEGFVSLGIGVTPPTAPVERDRIFVFTPDMSRGYLDVEMEAHARAGADQHEARIKITSSFTNVNYPGELIATGNGQILIAVPRTVLFGKGVEIFERYIFQSIEMPFDLPILLDGGNFTREEGKILLNGVALN